MEQRRARSTSRFGIGGVALLVALALVLAGTTAAFAAGAFESHDSGLDTAHDAAERGAVIADPTMTTGPSGVDDHGVADHAVEVEHAEPGDDPATGTVVVAGPHVEPEARGHDAELEPELEPGEDAHGDRIDNSEPGSTSSGPGPSGDASATTDDHGRHGHDGGDDASGGSSSGSASSGSGGSGHTERED